MGLQSIWKNAVYRMTGGIPDPYRASRNWHIVEAMVEYFISISFSGAFFARLTNSLGISDALTGILNAFASLGCLFQVASVYLFRRSAHVKHAVVLCQLANELLFIILYCIPVISLPANVKTAIFIVFYCLGRILANLISAPKTTWTMSLVNDRVRGSYVARMEIVSLLGGMLFTLLMGRLIDTLEANGNTEQALLACAITVAVLSGLHMLTFLPMKERKDVSIKTQDTGSMKEALGNRRLRTVVLMSALWAIANSCSSPYYGSYEIKELGFSMTLISVLTIIGNVARSVASPFIGRYADKRSFGRMIFLCYCLTAVSFFVNIFTVPSNGKLFFGIYFVLNSISMAGVGNGTTNLVMDCADGAQRRAAFALNSSVGGVIGFLTTCLMSPVVSKIQAAGNMLFGISMYPAQFVSALSFVLTVILAIYVKKRVIPADEQKTE